MLAPASGTVAAFIVTALTVKTLADAVGKARGRVKADVAVYVLGLAAVYLVAADSPATFVSVAILFRLAYLVERRVICAINHSFLELLLLVLILQLHDQPQSLIAILQLVIVSVWFYSVWQKIYQREFLNGAFLYVLMLTTHPAILKLALGLQGRSYESIERLEGRFAKIDGDLLRFAKYLAFGVAAAEALVPLAALTGGPWAAVGMFLLALPVGLISGELSFMLTNMVIAVIFFIPFDPHAVWAVHTDPAVIVICAWLVAWPPIHAYVSRRLEFSSWRLFGWGMYATVEARVAAVTPAGDMHQASRTNDLGPWIMSGFGASRVGFLRRFAWKKYFDSDAADHRVAAVLSSYAIIADRLVSRCVVCDPSPSIEDGRMSRYEVHDDASERVLLEAVGAIVREKIVREKIVRDETRA